MKGNLKILVLKELEKGEMTGYDIMARMHDVTGKKPSSGSVYPLLGDLLEKGLIKSREEGRKKIYSLTSKGKSSIARLLREKEELTMRLLSLINSFKEIENEKRLKPFLRIIKHFESKGDILIKNIDLAIDIKERLIEIESGSGYNKKEKELVKILRDTKKRLDILRKE